MKLTTAQLNRAADLASRITQLERARDLAEDTTTLVCVGGPSAQDPLAQRGESVEVRVPVHATALRMALVEQLTPLYTELRNLGIELQP